MSTTVVAVPGAKSMDDDTFFKHINARHLGDFGHGTLPFGTSPMWSPVVVLAYRAFHARVHNHALPGTYDHEHTGDNG